jgi:hypothetical protein
MTIEEKVTVLLNQRDTEHSSHKWDKFCMLSRLSTSVAGLASQVFMAISSSFVYSFVISLFAFNLDISISNTYTLS